MPEPEASTCPDCGGDGYQGDEFCETCMSGGSIPVIGLSRYVKERFISVVSKVDALATAVGDMSDRLDDTKDKVYDIKEKVDEIKEVVDDL